ncbi:MAG: ribbon-helix-helix domain-containing protein [Promethearchaeota archaeon]
MKIVTVNVPESYINAISKLVGENGLYPSRSELIRCAVRDFLLKELKLARNMQKWQVSAPEIENFDDKNFVRIPVSSKDENDEPVTEFKTYKILREA